MKIISVFCVAPLISLQLNIGGIVNCCVGWSWDRSNQVPLFSIPDCLSSDIIVYPPYYLFIHAAPRSASSIAASLPTTQPWERVGVYDGLILQWNTRLTSLTLVTRNFNMGSLTFTILTLQLSRGHNTNDTTTQHNLNTVVGSGMKMTVQTPPHTPTHPTHHRNSR